MMWLGVRHVVHVEVLQAERLLSTVGFQALAQSAGTDHLVATRCVAASKQGFDKGSLV
jgi:hypothetical protein